MDEIITIFGQLTNKRKTYKSEDDKYGEDLRVFTKRAYDFVKRQEEHKRPDASSLPILHVDGLDSEQIYQQVELLNNDCYARLLRDCNKLSGHKVQLEFEELQSSDEELEDDEPVDVVVTAKEKPLKVQKGDKKNKNVVEMEEDEEEMDLNEEESESEEEDIDYFSEMKFDDTFEDMNSEFFGENHGGEEDEENFEDDLENLVENLESGGKKRNLSDDEGGNEDDEGDSEDEENLEMINDKVGDGFDLRDKRDFESEKPPQKKDVKSTFELIEDRRKEKIKWLEDNALVDKDWYMKGEVRSKDRPENSALEEVLQFNVTSRPAPVITEETNIGLEDIIRRRIKDKSFDDVVRKAKHTETQLEFKKRLQLNQEKSKESLAQIYEKEYQKQVAAVNGEDQEKEEPPIYNELRKMQHELFSQLDALTNYHFTPRPAIPQLKIKTNLPVLQMEEVGPLAESDAMLLAPEQVAPRIKGDLIGKSERTKTDKLRERRKKKKFQKIKAQQNESKKKMVDVRKGKETKPAPKSKNKAG